MKKRMIVMTVSSKNSGYCVAGIDIDTNQWIRLVTEDEESEGALSKSDIICSNRSRLKVLDVIEVDVIRESPTKTQPENILLDNSEYTEYINRLGKVELVKAIQYLNQPKVDYIFGNSHRYISQEQMQYINYSLILVKVEDLLLKVVEYSDGVKKTKADFRHCKSKYENMSVTDPDYYSITGNEMINEAYLVISIGTPFKGKYYKFVSKIFVIKH